MSVYEPFHFHSVEEVRRRIEELALKPDMSEPLRRFHWPGREDLNLRPLRPRQLPLSAESFLFSSAYLSRGYGHPLEAC
ncbi:MAG: hypothetical protein AAB225_18735 [Acidobacteriota bacterium]